MAVYVADRYLPGITMQQLAATQKAMIETSQSFTQNGEPVRYIRSIYLPGESRCLSLFEAASLEFVKELNKVVGIPFTRIVEALELTP